MPCSSTHLRINILRLVPALALSSLLRRLLLLLVRNRRRLPLDRRRPLLVLILLIAHPPPLAPAALLLLLAAIGIGKVRSAARLPRLLALGNSLEELLVHVRLALLAPVILRHVLGVRADANADIMLPCAASVAGDPRFARVVVLLRRAADAPDHLVLGLLFLLVGRRRRLLAALPLLPLRRVGRVIELVEWFRVLAFRGADGASRFGFAWRCVSVLPLSVPMGEAKGSWRVRLPPPLIALRQVWGRARGERGASCLPDMMDRVRRLGTTSSIWNQLYRPVASTGRSSSSWKEERWHEERLRQSLLINSYERLV